ncbi:hypothetical protein DMUE_3655 [Dictyocoela muelleri]|nr:hypothetical protein DMUE_3655 [Dictyocoela muelleri]
MGQSFDNAWTFLHIRNCVKEAIIDIKITEEFRGFIYGLNKFFFELINALHPIKTTVEELCRRYSNFFTADIAISYILKKLKYANSSIIKRLYKAIITRMKERRLHLSSLFYYLHKGTSNVSEPDFIMVSSPIECFRLIVN